MDVSSPTRAIPFSTMFNFRDVGGYPTTDGRAVRWRRFYRSDSPHRVHEGDEDTFTALGVRTVIDLRRPAEVSRDGRVPAYAGLDYRHIYLKHQDWDQIPYEERQGPARYLANRYHDLTEQAADGVAAAIGLIADDAAAPVMVHCVAGKDRTGLICALTLSVLGVPDEVIAEDYALTSAGQARFTAWLASKNPAVRSVPKPFFDSPVEAMSLFLTELRARYGSPERYLRSVGVSTDQLTALRTHLLT